MMRYQDIAKKKQRVKRLFWTLLILLLGLASSGWLSPIGAEVKLCGIPLEPVREGFYRLRGHLTCEFSEMDVEEILYIDEEGAKFDLRDFTATGDIAHDCTLPDCPLPDGILIEADGVKIVGGTFRNCNTALYVKKHDKSKIEKFKAINSSGIGIRLRGEGNSIVKSLCINAGDTCFRLRVADNEDTKGNTAKWCTAVNSGGRGFRFRGPGHGYELSAFDSGGEGIQINEEKGLSGVTINRCIIVNSAKHGIEIEDGTDNLIMHNIVFENGDGIDFWDLTDRNEECEGNVWKNNKFETRNLDCIN